MPVTEGAAEQRLNVGTVLGNFDAHRAEQTLEVVFALGHPFAATGARIAGTLGKLLSNSGKKRGLISICTAGGMGIAAILEAV